LFSQWIVEPQPAQLQPDKVISKENCVSASAAEIQGQSIKRIHISEYIYFNRVRVTKAK